MGRKNDFYLPSSDGKSRIHGISWKPEGKILAVLQIAHGMAEHIGRYGEFAEKLNESGIAVIGHDHLGHGRTTEKNRHGIFADENGAYYLLEDLRTVGGYGKEQYPGVKHILLGHSMGSFLARRYLTIHGDTVDGVILLGTGEPPALLLRAGAIVIQQAVRRGGREAFNRLLHNLVLGGYNRAFEPGETKHDWLTRDVSQARAYEADPDCQFLFSNGAYEDFFQIMLDLKRKKQFGRIPVNLPVLFLSGDCDPVGDKGAGVRRACKALKEAGVRDVSMKLYEEARHELLNEVNREEVTTDILNWIKVHI